MESPAVQFERISHIENEFTNFSFADVDQFVSHGILRDHSTIQAMSCLIDSVA